MSAVNSSLSDREHEALRRAQRAHEPSMEEILASIRTIIAEEREPAKSPEPAAAAGKADSPAPAAQVVYSRDDPTSARLPAGRPHPADPSAAKGSTGRTPPAPERELSEKSSEPAGEPLVSPRTDKAVGNAFNALSASLAARSAGLAEEMARDMLRPMLKAWLDENLPGIVERLVRAEIERIAGGSG